MQPLAVQRGGEAAGGLAPADAAIARSVLYAALFDYPLTLSQLRHTLIGARLTPGEIVRTVGGSPALASVVAFKDGFFFPSGREDLIAIRRRREQRSRAFLRVHRPLLRLIAAMPYVRMVALSGSIAHMNLETGGDLDLFIVTRGRRVWSTAVAVILLARLLGRRRTVCANYIVSDEALAFDQQDLFAANQVINLKPLSGAPAFRLLLEANPFVREHYPNFHAPACAAPPLDPPWPVRWCASVAERLLVVPAALAERMCRIAYRAYLRRQSGRWQSPEQVRLDDCVLKLHTRSHRREILTRFDAAVHGALD